MIGSVQSPPQHIIVWLGTPQKSKIDTPKMIFVEMYLLSDMASFWNIHLRFFRGRKLPSRELTYPPKIGILKMIFLFPRWGYVRIPWRVPFSSEPFGPLYRDWKTKNHRRPTSCDVHQCIELFHLDLHWILWWHGWGQHTLGRMIKWT